MYNKWVNEDANSTNLSSIWKNSDFWWDSLLLLVMWSAVFFLPDHIYKVPVAIILKVVALVASLEMISFLAYQFVDKKNGLFLQGFLGGFASSTTVFVQITQDHLRNDPFKRSPKQYLFSLYFSQPWQCS